MMKKNKKRLPTRCIANRASLDNNERVRDFSKTCEKNTI